MNNPNHSRTLAARFFAAVLLLTSMGSASAAVRYVDVNSTNAVPPYTSWLTAATNIQDAVDVALAGEEIVVTNGVYAPITVNKALMLGSVNGPRFTTINGVHSRCAYLSSNATLAGFTLTNGLVRGGLGGGVFCESATAVLSNCVLSGNAASTVVVVPGVLIYLGYGGGASGGTLNNCMLIANSSAAIGGGAYRSRLNDCILIGNSAIDGGGASQSTLNNCTLADNSASYGGAAEDCTLNNCTLTGNHVVYAEDGSAGGGAYGGTLNNCIAYSNDGGNYDSATLNYSCTTPLPSNGVGNITNAPLFVNSAGGNYRLCPDSPCIDAGTNLSASITNDLDGRPRPLDGNGDGLAAFDMGAYEYRTPLLVCQDSPNPAPPHSGWTNAAHTIQDAVDAAVAGDEIVVTNGIYATDGRVASGTTNRVALDKSVSLRSVNGPQSTTIDGGRSNRCVSLANGASLSGFTLTNGFASHGAGVFCESQTSVVSNCVIAGNWAYLAGGGARQGTLNNCILRGNTAFYSDDEGIALVYGSGGGASGSTLNNCTLTGNSAPLDGGGAHSSTLNNCALTGNSAREGGGASTSSLSNCTLTGNSARRGGGAAASALNNCTLTSNSVRSGIRTGFDLNRDWAHGGGASFCTLNNCTLSSNRAGGYFDALFGYIPAFGGGASVCTLNNCTLTGNFADHGGAAYGGTLNNSVSFSNSAEVGANYSYSTLNYSCTTPQPTNGVGNITNEPLFVDQASGNLRLQSSSPCINAGRNAFAPSGPDLDGNLRVVRRTVDIGAYEFQGLGSMISYAWLQQYALPTDGSVDTADPDGDRMNNWQEWQCGTDPTNAQSALRLLAPAVVGSDLLVRWESVAGRTYFLERSTNLAASPAFTPLATNLAGQPGTTTYMDTKAFDGGPFFYRVGVGD